MLFLLGLRWSATLVAGSTLLTPAVAQHDRPGVQRASDPFMGLSAGLGAGLSGVIVGVWGHPTLSLTAAALSVALGLGRVGCPGRHTGSLACSRE